MTSILLAAVMLVCPAPMAESNHYERAIDVVARHYGADPNLVRCIVQAESEFFAGAIGNAGEIGLMQILPQTGEFFAEKMGLPPNPDLFDPLVNLSLGCWGLANGYESWWSTYRQCECTKES